MNLILNARQAMLSEQSKGRRLTIYAQTLSDSVEIKVADTGCGIKPANIEKIVPPTPIPRAAAIPSARDFAIAILATNTKLGPGLMAPASKAPSIKIIEANISIDSFPNLFHEYLCKLIPDLHYT